MTAVLFVENSTRYVISSEGTAEYPPSPRAICKAYTGHQYDSRYT